MANRDSLIDPEVGNNLFVQNTDAVAAAKDYAKTIQDQAELEKQSYIKLFELQKAQQEQIQKTKLEDIKQVLAIQQETNKMAYKHNLDLIERQKNEEIKKFTDVQNARSDINAAGKKELIDAKIAELEAIAENQKKQLEKTAKSLGLDKTTKATQEKAEKKAIQARKKELYSTLKNADASQEDQLAA